MGRNFSSAFQTEKARTEFNEAAIVPPLHVTSNELEFFGIMKSTHIYIPFVAQKGDFSFGAGGRCPKINLVEFWPKQDDGVNRFLIFARRVPCFNERR